MQMLGGRQGQGGPAGNEPPAGGSDYQPAPKKAGNAAKPSFDDLDDDIPF
jgi:single-stranded DNA-binding protein